MSWLTGSAKPEVLVTIAFDRMEPNSGLHYITMMSSSHCVDFNGQMGSLKDLAEVCTVHTSSFMKIMLE